MDELITEITTVSRDWWNEKFEEDIKMGLDFPLPKLFMLQKLMEKWVYFMAVN